MQDTGPILACNSFKEITAFIINYYDTSLLGRLQKNMCGAHKGVIG